MSEEFYQSSRSVDRVRRFWVRSKLVLSELSTFGRIEITTQVR